MKKLKLFIGLLGAAMLLPACSEDEIQGYDPGQAESDMTQYMAIQIVSPNEGSRAFDQGVWNENDVETLDFIFYDKSGTPTAAMKNFKKTDGTWYPTTGGTGKYESGNVSRIWMNVVPVDLIQGQNIPAQVVCLVNATSADATEASTMTLSQLREKSASSYSADIEGKQLFVMSNSVYFGKDVVTGLDNQRLCATPINKLYDQKSDALTAINGLASDPSQASTSVVTVYVERLAAKIGLNLSSENVKKYTLRNGDGNGNVTLTFVPEYWFVNATSNNAYLTKRYGIENSDGTLNYSPTYTELNKKFADTGLKKWNDGPNHRSYWGCSPSYYQESYPKVSDNVNDLEEGTAETTYANTYYSYTDVKAEATKTDITKQALAYENGFKTVTSGEGESATCSGYIYTRETTAAISEINSGENPAAAVASAVIIGHYYAGETAPTAGSEPTFYIDRHDGDNGTYYASEDNVMKVLAGRQNTIFKKTGEGESINYSTLTADEIMSETYKEKFTIEHPLYAVREKLTNKNVPGRLVTLQLSSGAATASSGLYYYDAATTSYIEITDATKLATANAALCTTGYMDMYSGGLAFFSVPIRHLGFDVDVEADKPLLTGTMKTEGEGESATTTLDTSKPVTYKWSNMRIGDLGVVRNHVYTLTVTEISGLGSGLRDPEQPIVPPVDVISSYVAMRLNILSWNVVPAWSVAL